MENHAKLNK